MILTSTIGHSERLVSSTLPNAMEREYQDVTSSVSSLSPSSPHICVSNIAAPCALSALCDERAPNAHHAY